jgi:hypothetical protein
MKRSRILATFRDEDALPVALYKTGWMPAARRCYNE